MPDVKALFFDVFGTLVDWRTSIARETEALLGPLDYSIDWPAFAVGRTPVLASCASSVTS